MTTPKQLTLKQRRFVAEYLVDLNATQAAIRCGYSPKTAYAQGSRLLSKVEVSAAVADGSAKQIDKAGVTAARVLEELARLALVDMRGFWDEAGNLKPVSELDEAQGACLASMEVIKKNAEAGDGVIDTVHKFKVWDKPKALDILAKHFGLLKESVDVSGNVTVTWQTPQ